MTGIRAAVHRATLPCERDPERWFDKNDRRHALNGCLSCPRRRSCAREALECGATFGMWAGVWVEDNLAELAGVLAEVAAAAPPPGHSPPLPQAQPRTPITISVGGRLSIDHDAAAPPSVELDAVSRRVLAVIAARSSGHCEAMTSRCRYTFDTVGSRIDGRIAWDAASSSEAYAVCRPCKAAIESAEPVFVRRLGYLVDEADEPASTAFYWRQTRWVYLDDGGCRIRQVASHAEHAALSTHALNGVLAAPPSPAVGNS